MTIVPRGGRFGVKVWNPGTRSYRWIGTFPTLAEAQRADEDHATGGAMSVARWSRVWLADYARGAAATRRTYGYAAERIVKELGQREMGALSRPEARRLAGTWPRGTTRVARTMWADAVRDGVCEQNPFTNLRLETPRGRKDLEALSEAQIAELADVAERVHGDYGSEARAIILTLAYVGLRPGELCALRRDDLNVAQSELTVRFNLDASGEEKLPKNGKPRIVVVPPLALEAIRQMPTLAHSPYLFHTMRGKRLSKGTVSYLWRPIGSAWLEKHGQRITPYHLRHACATLLIHRGLPAHVVANQLGHSDGGRLVQALYGHPEHRWMREQTLMAFAEVPVNAERARRSA